MKPSIPDRSSGGTFEYDKDGKFIKHEPPTKPVADATPAPAPEPVPDTTTTTDDAQPSRLRRGRNTEE